MKIPCIACCQGLLKISNNFTCVCEIRLINDAINYVTIMSLVDVAKKIVQEVQGLKVHFAKSLKIENIINPLNYYQ